MKKLLVLLLILQLACVTSAIAQPTQMTAKVAPAPTAIEARLAVALTPVSVGNVTAEVLHVRADHDLSAEVVGYLYSNDLALEMGCFTEDNITWVKHQTGWSVVRNKTAEYIAGVCDG